MKIKFNILFACIAVGVFYSCEKEYTPAKSEDGPKYVVEGFIEAGENPFPPYLILTKTFDFYGSLSPDQFTASFVHDADVRVTDGSQEVVLQEVCFSDLPPELRKEVAAQFGFDADSLAIDYCVYLDVSGQLQPVEDKSYDLKIVAEGHTITATTHIPLHVPLDSVHFEAPPGMSNDTLAQLRASISDPAGIRNFYRYFGATNGGALQTSFSSVTEDLFFDGKTFEFQLFNPKTTESDVEPDVFGLYFVGDSMTIKWCNMDEAHFDFWNTLEFSNANQGPFSSYTRLASNIHGGLGIWGGYSVSYYTRKVAY
ncbi:MAG TPA: DUF4249 domain-containing protein [Saprospiraceae bacterium]|nr:DUF4249 domain-containing protein [Saprospiraceae bacterium]